MFNNDLHRRSIHDGPWCWQDKHWMRRINEVFSEYNAVAAARSIAVALTELASDRQSETFEVPKSAIIARSGLHERRVTDLLKLLEVHGFIHVLRQQRKHANTVELLPNVYTILPSGNGCTTPSGNGCTTPSGNGCTTPSGNGCTTLMQPTETAPNAENRIIEEESKNNRKKKDLRWETLTHLPDELNTQEFITKWQEWLKYRSEMKLKPLLPRSIQATWKALAKFGHEGAIAKIDLAIANQWQGCVFPDKKATMPTPPTPAKSEYYGG